MLGGYQRGCTRNDCFNGWGIIWDERWLSRSSSSNKHWASETLKGCILLCAQRGIHSSVLFRRASLKPDYVNPPYMCRVGGAKKMQTAPTALGDAPMPMSLQVIMQTALAPIPALPSSACRPMTFLPPNQKKDPRNQLQGKLHIHPHSFPPAPVSKYIYIPKKV